MAPSARRAGLLVGLGAHEERHQRHVRIDLVIGELLQPLGDRVVIGVHPGMRGVRADELEAERAKAVLAGPLDGLQLRARHPQRRMRLLHGFRHHVAQGNVEIFAVMLGAHFGEHRKDRLHRLLEHLALGFHVAAERRQFGDRRALAHAEFAAAVGEQIEHRDFLGDAGGMIGRELEDAVAEPDLLGALAGGGEEGFRRRESANILPGNDVPPPRRGHSPAGRRSRAASGRSGRAGARRPLPMGAAVAARKRCRIS